MLPSVTCSCLWNLCAVAMDIRRYCKRAPSRTESNSAGGSENERMDPNDDDAPGPSKRVCTAEPIRKYNEKREKSFTWLCYNEDIGGAFCSVCQKWANSSKGSGGVWVDKPFTNWNKAIEKMRSHNGSKIHQDIVVRLHCYLVKPKHMAQSLSNCNRLIKGSAGKIERLSKH